MTELAILVAVVVFPAIMVCTCLWDLTSYRIPNGFTLALIAAFLFVAPFTGMGWWQFGQHFAVAGLVFIVGFALWSLQSFGWKLVAGGDVKLMAGAALWFGTEATVPFLVYTGILGALLSFVILFARRWPVPAFLEGQAWIMQIHQGRKEVPYGVAMGPAALLVFAHSSWMTFAVTGTLAG